jgi:hypothetical protein
MAKVHVLRSSNPPKHTLLESSCHWLWLISSNLCLKGCCGYEGIPRVGQNLRENLPMAEILQCSGRTLCGTWCVAVQAIPGLISLKAKQEHIFGVLSSHKCRNVLRSSISKYGCSKKSGRECSRECSRECGRPCSRHPVPHGRTHSTYGWQIAPFESPEAAQRAAPATLPVLAATKE